MVVVPINHITRQTDSGQPLIGDNSMPVAILIATINNQPDTDLEAIATKFNLTLGQVHAALSYYYDHADEIDAIWNAASDYLEQPHHQTVDDLRAKIERRRAE